MNTDDSRVIKQQPLGEYHTYKRDDRKAVVLRDVHGFYVNLYLRSDKIYGDGDDSTYMKVQTRDCYEHSESWAESVAENYVDGVLNV